MQNPNMIRNPRSSLHQRRSATHYSSVQMPQIPRDPQYQCAEFKFKHDPKPKVQSATKFHTTSDPHQCSVRMTLVADAERPTVEGPCPKCGAEWAFDYTYPGWDGVLPSTRARILFEDEAELKPKALQCPDCKITWDIKGYRKITWDIKDYGEV